MFRRIPARCLLPLTLIALLAALGCSSAEQPGGVSESGSTPPAAGGAGQTPRTPGPPGQGTVHAASLAAGGGGLTTGDNGISRLAMSADGRWFAMVSSSTNLVPGQHDQRTDTHQPELFLHDRVEKTTVLVSHHFSDPTLTGISISEFPVISADGRYVAYASASTDLVPSGQTIYPNQVFLYDRETGQNTLISRVAGSELPVEAASWECSISADGRWVAYRSSARNLVADQVDPGGTEDIFLYDRDSGESILVSRAPGTAATAANASSDMPAISADGSFIAYVSDATDLVAGLNDANGDAVDIFLYDCKSGENQLVSFAVDAPTTTCDDGTGNGRPGISDDGRFVVYVSHATDIVSQMQNTTGDVMVYLFDRVEGTNVLVSHKAGQPKTTGLGIAEQPVISGDGNWVAYASEADDLVAGVEQGDVCRNIFLYERASGLNRLVSHTSTSTHQSAAENSFTPAISRDGRYVAFDSDAPNLAAGQKDEEMGLDLFLYDRETAGLTLVSHRRGEVNTGVNSGPGDIALSDDGRITGFVEFSDELVEGDSNSITDGFWFELE